MKLNKNNTKNSYIASKTFFF